MYYPCLTVPCGESRSLPVMTGIQIPNTIWVQFLEKRKSRNGLKFTNHHGNHCLFHYFSHSFQPISTKLHDKYYGHGKILAIKFLGDLLIKQNFMAFSAFS